MKMKGERSDLSVIQIMNANGKQPLIWTNFRQGYYILGLLFVVGYISINLWMPDGIYDENVTNPWRSL